MKCIRKTLPTGIKGIRFGFQGGYMESEVFTNNIIWFAHNRVETRYWNAFGLGAPFLRRSNPIIVEVNPAFDYANKKVSGLFAHDESGHIVLLHRGKLGGKKGKSRDISFMEWYQGEKVAFSDPSTSVNSAILVAVLDSEKFLSQIETFVVAVNTYKNGDPTEISDADLKEVINKGPTKSKSSYQVIVTYHRDPKVAELSRRRAAGKCDLCKRPAPFTKVSGEPYLECHHVEWLARGGHDNLENTVALCPNCHRKMHIVDDPDDVQRLKIRAKDKLSD